MSASGPSNAAVAPERAADFIGAIGVNIHLGHAGYSAANVIADMAYLGLDAVRQHAIGPRTSLNEIATFDALAAAGIKFDWLTGGPLPGTLKALDAFVAAHPGSIATVEGPNEVNNFPITYHRLTGTAGALAYQQALYTAVKGNPLTAGIPVLNFTDYPMVIGAADAMNVHIYPSGGGEPQAPLAEAVAQMRQLAPGDPAYLTEAGYYDLPGPHQGREGVNALTQAKLTLNLIMDAASLGVSATYLYDLVDDGRDLTNSYAIDHFGLFTLGNQPKPVATAIHNLTTILADTGANAASFTPTSLSYTLTNLPSTGSSLVIETSAGVYDIVVWNEPTIWNSDTHTPIAVSSQSVGVILPSSAARLTVFDPLASTNATKSVKNSNRITISLTDHPLIVQVTGFVQAMAGLAAPSGLADAAAASPPAPVTSNLLAAHTS